jgi:hypothetical protein
MAQAVSRRPPTAEAQVRSRISPCGICRVQSGIGTGFSPEFFGFPLSISFHRCSITRTRTKNNNHHHHRHHRVAQEASWLPRGPTPLKKKYQKGKGKAICVRSMKVCGGRGGIAPLILNLGTRWRWVDSFIFPVEPYPIPTIRCLAGCTSDLDALKKRKLSCPYRHSNWFLGLSACISTELSRLHLVLRVGRTVWGTVTLRSGRYFIGEWFSANWVTQ